MSFIESPRFPEGIGYRSIGGPAFRTGVVETLSGREYRNSRWSQSLRRYDLAHGAKTQEELDELIAFFESVAVGRGNMFRFKDWADYAATIANGRLGTGVGDGTPSLQLVKVYASGANSRARDIQKPVSGTVLCYRNASPITVGASAGNIAISTTTGLVTFVADVSVACALHTPGASHVFTTASDITGLIIGSKVYLRDVTGTAASTLNGLAHTISNKSGSGPYTWTISTVTTGLTASSGFGEKFPQASDALTAAFEFDVPVRFDVDEFMSSPEAPGVYRIDSLPLVERRV